MRLFGGAPDVKKLSRKGDVKGLIKALSFKNDPEVRADAAYELMMMGDQKAFEPFLVSLKDNDARVREYAVRGLGVIGHSEAVNPLIAALQDPEASVRQYAAKSLHKIGDIRAVEPLIDKLNDKEHTVRDASTRALGKIGSPATKALVKATESPDYLVRAHAAEALGRIGSASVADPIINLLDDKIETVRTAAVKALGRIGGTQVIDILITRIGKGSPDVRSSAAKALEMLSDDSFEPLRDYFSRAPKHEALAAVGGFKRAEAVDLLVIPLEYSEEEVQLAALNAFGAISDSRALKNIITSIQSRSLSLRGTAMKVLIQICNKNPRVLRSLFDMAKSHPQANQFLTTEAMEMVNRLGATGIEASYMGLSQDTIHDIIAALLEIPLPQNPQGQEL